MTTPHRRGIAFFRRAATVLFLGIAAVSADSLAAPAATSASAPAGAKLFVAVNGKKSGDGTMDRPFATLEQARDKIRQLRKSPGALDKGMTVYLRGGVYERTAPFELSAEDSGSANAPIRYAAWGEEVVRIVGGRRLDASWCTPVGSNSPAAARLPPAGRDKILQVDLSAHGLSDIGKGVPRAGWGWNGRSGLELFSADAPMEMARWPAEGFAYVGTTPDGKKGKTFSPSKGLPQSWQTRDVWVGGLVGTNWFYSLQEASIDPAGKIITLSQAPQYGLKPGQPFVVLNVLEELSKPGQWCLDHKTKTLYFWPPKSGTSELYVSTLEDTLVKMTNVSYVEFRNMALEITRGALVKIDGGRGNRIVGCALRNAGTHGADITGVDNGLDGCVVSYVGERGVSLNGGDRATLAAGGNFVRNTEIHHWGRLVRTSKAAVHVQGVGQIVSHCLMHDAPHTAIWYYGNNHLIEYNDIHHVCQECSDAGAIYSGRDWGHRGVVIRNNFVHDLASVLQKADIYGLYMDDAVSAATVDGNVFYRIDGTATFNAGGRDNVYANNVFARCTVAHLADRRGMDIINDTPGHDCNFLEKLNKAAGGDYTKGVWATAYPSLAKIPNNYAQMNQGGFKNPGGCVLSRNIGFANKSWTKEGSWGGFLHALDYYQEKAENVTDADPLFVDETKGNLLLKPESPAYRIKGWQKIPFDEIGPVRRGD